jgi:hypothetical protein
MWASKVYTQVGRRIGKHSHSDVALCIAATTLLISLNLSKETDDSGSEGCHNQTARDAGLILSSPYRSVRCDAAEGRTHHVSRLRRHRTLDKMQITATKETLPSKYDVIWTNPIGEGTFGKVFIGCCKAKKETIHG